MITFVFSSPRHHVELMVPVARALGRRGIAARFVSMTELRGFRTPALDFEVRRVIPLHLRRDPSAGAGIGTVEGRATGVRLAAQRVIWRGVLSPRLRRLLRGSDVVVVPNDAAYPYQYLARTLRDAGTPFALVQEGVRFPIPGERNAAADVYGTAGAAAVCVWGEAAAAHFTAAGVPAGSIQVTGNPRFDAIDPRAWAASGAALNRRLGFERRPLLYLSSPIDDLGFCSTADKLALFERFVAAAVPVLAREDRGLVVKLHPREEVAGFRAVVARLGVAGVEVVDGESIFTVLAAGHAAVTQVSTVGLEALAFGLALAVLPVPGHGHVFDYVSSGAAIGLADGGLTAGLTALLALPRDQPTAAAAAYLERQLAHRGTAAERVATCLAELAVPR